MENYTLYNIYDSGTEDDSISKSIKKTIIRMQSKTLHILRHLAALAVLYDHSYPLRGLPSPFIDLFGFQISPGLTGAMTFFCISGFLIAASRMRSESGMTYFIKRIQRIYPALIAATLFTICVIGPLSTSLSLSQYFLSSTTLLYLFNGLVPDTIAKLPGVFSTLPYAHANGSTWTIRTELWLYLFIGLFFIRPLRTRPLLLGSILISIPALIWLSGGIERVEATPITRYMHITCFISGSFLALFSEKIRFNLLGGTFCIILSAIWKQIEGNLGNFMICLCMPYLIFTLAYYCDHFLHNFHFKRIMSVDYSYGFYLMAWPMQNLLIQYGGLEYTFLNALFLPFLLALSWASFSWHCIEKPFLRKKR